MGDNYLPEGSIGTGYLHDHCLHLQSALAKTLVLNAQRNVVSNPKRDLKIDIPFFCSGQSMAGGALLVLLPSPHELSR